VNTRQPDGHGQRLPTSADHLVDGLIAHGVDTVFGIPGVQTYELFDSFARSEAIRVIGARHDRTTDAPLSATVERTTRASAR